jgi:hypothetical protein
MREWVQLMDGGEELAGWVEGDRWVNGEIAWAAADLGP